MPAFKCSGPTATPPWNMMIWNVMSVQQLISSHLEPKELRSPVLWQLALLHRLRRLDDDLALWERLIPEVPEHLVISPESLEPGIGGQGQRPQSQVGLGAHIGPLGHPVIQRVWNKMSSDSWGHQVTDVHLPRRPRGSATPAPILPAVLRPEKEEVEARPSERPARNPLPLLMPYLMRPRLLLSRGAPRTEVRAREVTSNTWTCGVRPEWSLKHTMLYLGVHLVSIWAVANLQLRSWMRGWDYLYNDLTMSWSVTTWAIEPYNPAQATQATGPARVTHTPGQVSWSWPNK